MEPALFLYFVETHFLCYSGKLEKVIDDATITVAYKEDAKLPEEAELVVSISKKDKHSLIGTLTNTVTGEKHEFTNTREMLKFMEEEIGEEIDVDWER